MKNILRQQRRSSMVAAVVTILMGVLLIFVPNRSSDLVLIHRLTKAFRQTDGDWYE